MPLLFVVLVTPFASVTENGGKGYVVREVATKFEVP
jgi:hypothetical protein